MTDVTVPAWDWNHERKFRLVEKVKPVPPNERNWFSDEAWLTYQHVCREKRIRSYVYFVDVGDDPANPVKIGTTTQSPSVRIASLQSSNWQPLVIRQIVFGDRDLEKTLHELWADFRLGKGEWFSNREIVLAVANNIARLQLEGRWLQSRFASALEVSS